MSMLDGLDDGISFAHHNCEWALIAKVERASFCMVDSRASSPVVQVHQMD